MPTTIERLRGRASREAKRVELELARRRGRDFIDYGWIKLLYTGDGDLQEIYYHLDQARWYDKDLTIFRSLVAPGQTVIDVGANLGFVTTILASLVGPTGRVISFEPSPTIYRKLLRTIELNGLEQVIALNLGLGEEPDLLQLHEVSSSSGNSSLLGSASPASVDVRVLRLDEVPEARETRVSLLKIDTEGFEPFVLSGATQLIREDRPIIYLEMGGDYVESTLRSIRILDDLGYDTSHVASVDWSQFGNGSDFFFLPS